MRRRRRARRWSRSAFEVAPYRPASVDTDPATGNRIAAFSARRGSSPSLCGAGGDRASRSSIPPMSWRKVPRRCRSTALRFLYPSRYCQADLVQQRAWDLFGRPAARLCSGASRSATGCARTSNSAIGTSRTAARRSVDTLRDGAGVCRDFAHTMISYCRALNYPSRFVTACRLWRRSRARPARFPRLCRSADRRHVVHVRPDRHFAHHGAHPHRHRPRRGGRLVRHDLRAGAYRHAEGRVRERSRILRRGSSHPCAPSSRFPPRA